jgi:hypothetical protein
LSAEAEMDTAHNEQHHDHEESTLTDNAVVALPIDLNSVDKYLIVLAVAADFFDRHPSMLNYRLEVGVVFQKFEICALIFFPAAKRISICAVQAIGC